MNGSGHSGNGAGPIDGPALPDASVGETLPPADPDGERATGGGGLSALPGAVAGGVVGLVRAPFSIAETVVMAGPRAIGALDGMIKDVHAMSRSTEVLPAVIDELSAIHQRVNNLDDEVMQMRASVGDIDDQVDKLAELSKSLEDLTESLHPIRNATDRINRIRGRRGGPGAAGGQTS